MSIEQETWRAFHADLARKGEPGLVITMCPKHFVKTGERLETVTPLNKYAFKRVDYAERGQPQWLHVKMNRRGCPQCEAEGFKGLAGLGYDAETHAAQGSDQMRLAYGTAADLESSLEKGNCEAAFSDLLRLTAWGTGAALNAQAAGSGEEEVAQRMSELQRNGATAFKKKCLIKRRR